MRIIATKRQVAEMVARLRQVGKSDGWTTRFIDPSTGKRWTQIYLGSENHGGGLPILVPDPAPTIADLLNIAETSNEPAEVAASVWRLAESDREGVYHDQLLAIAESAARKGDQRRAALLIGWGRLTGVANLRPTLGKSPAEVSADHEYFKRIAHRAKALLRQTASDPLLRDRRVFDGEPS